MLTYNDFEQHRKFMEGVARRQGLRQDEAEDVAAESLVKVYIRGTKEGFQCMSYDGKPNTWYLYTVTRNLAIDLLKKKREQCHAEVFTDEHEDIDYTEADLSHLCGLFEYLSEHLDRHHYNLARLYFLKSISINSISRETSISRRTLYGSLKSIRKAAEAYKEANYQKDIRLDRPDCDIRTLFTDLPNRRRI